MSADQKSNSDKQFFGLPKMLLTLDMFSEPLPGFNMRGQKSVRTHAGGCLSLLIMYVMFYFAMIKLQHLYQRHNPTVNDYIEWGAISEEELWKGSENSHFMMAWAVVDYVTGDVKDDPKFVKWYAEYIHSVNGTKTYTELKMYDCTEEDFKKFYIPDVASEQRVKKFRKNGGFKCIDWSEITLAGTEFGSDFRTMDIMYLPCN